MKTQMEETKMQVWYLNGRIDELVTTRGFLASDAKRKALGELNQMEPGELEGLYDNYKNTHK